MTKSTPRKRVALVLFSEPMLYPPTMNAAAILAEAGHLVDIIGVRHETPDYYPVPDGTRLIYRGKLRRGFGFRWDFANYCLYLARRAREVNYDWIFSYNMTAAFPGYFASRLSGARWLYHVHDTTVVSNRLGFYGLLKFLERRCARAASAVVFPQAQRARLFASEAGLAKPPYIVMNGPRLAWPAAAERDAEVLEFKKRCQRLVIYQGGLNWRRGLRQLIQSVPKWRSSAGLCLMGKVDGDSSFEREVMELAARLGVKERVLLRKAVPYLTVPEITRLCDVGLGVMATPEQNKCVNIRHLAGASNKLAEYLACGLPVVVPDTDDYREFVRKAEVGILVQPGESESIAQGVDSLLGDASLYNRFSQNATRIFRDSLNYEKQFSPILELVSRD